jgi:hypothetical protein
MQIGAFLKAVGLYFDFILEIPELRGVYMRAEIYQEFCSIPPVFLMALQK